MQFRTIIGDVQISHLHQQWSVPARILTWHDGDSVYVLGETKPYDWEVLYVRVARINAPELSAEMALGLKARDFANSLLPRNSVVRLTSEAKDNYGRFLAEVLFGGDFFGKEDRNFSDEMLASGHAIEYGKRTGVAFQP